jgi:hypothetical protein
MLTQLKSDILISDRADFKARRVTEDRELHCIMIKGSVLQEIITCMHLTKEH